MPMLDEETVPKLAAGVRLRFDPVRGAWMLLAPERLFQPDETAVEILKLVDGQRTVGTITDTLAALYEAPRTLIATDVATMLQDLSDRGALRL
jgi:pyrroloquinoline quinone biosynthesis protein D